MSTDNGQSAAKALIDNKSNETGSTTIPNGSTGSNTGKKQIYYKYRNVIYKITNIITNKIYIGSASYYDKRIGTHIHRLRKNDHDNMYLQNAYNKYGESSFEFEIIEHCEKDNLLEKEQYWLDYYKSYDRENGYNLVKIAGSNRGYKMTEESRKRVSDANAFRGKKYSEEQRLKRKEQITKLQGKPVIQYDKDLNIIEEFPSISEASRKTGCSIATVSRQCSCKRSGKKYIFRYKDIV